MSAEYTQEDVVTIMSAVENVAADLGLSPEQRSSFRDQMAMVLREFPHYGPIEAAASITLTLILDEKAHQEALKAENELRGDQIKLRRLMKYIN